MVPTILHHIENIELSSCNEMELILDNGNRFMTFESMNVSRVFCQPEPNYALSNSDILTCVYRSLGLQSSSIKVFKRAENSVQTHHL